MNKKIKLSGEDNIVLDVNVFISAIAFKSKIMREIIKITSRDANVVFSQQLIKELAHTLQNKFDYSDEHIEVLLRQLKRFKLYFPDTINTLEADPKDAYLLDVCESSEARYLVTGDKKHLIPLKNHKGCEIIKPADFLEGVKNV